MNHRRAARRVRRLRRKLDRVPHGSGGAHSPQRQQAAANLRAAEARAEELRRTALSHDARAAEDDATAAQAATSAAAAATAAQQAAEAAEAAKAAQDAAEAARRLWDSTLGTVEHGWLTITCRVCAQPHTVELTDSQASELRHQRHQITASRLREDTLDRDAWAPAANRFKGLTDDPDAYGALRAYVMSWGWRHHACRHNADTVARPAAASNAR